MGKIQFIIFTNQAGGGVYVSAGNASVSSPSGGSELANGTNALLSFASDGALVNDVMSSLSMFTISLNRVFREKKMIPESAIGYGVYTP